MADVEVAVRRRFDVWNEVPLVPQTTGMSCWAASAAMLIGWRESIPVDPQEVASGIGRWSDFKDGLHPVDVAALAETWGLRTDGRDTWTPDELRQVLERYGPIWLGEASPALHSIVVAGMHGDGTPDGTWVRINDPWPVGRGERYTITWRQLMQNFHAATELAGVHAQVLHTGGRGRGSRGMYRYEERREIRREPSPTPDRPRPEEVAMRVARNGRRSHHEEYTASFAGLATAKGVIAAGTQYLDTRSSRPDPLEGHAGTGENLYLCWTELPDDLQSIDVVVHIHGFSSLPPSAATLRGKVAGSGLDLTGARGGRDRPTLGIIPRGRKITAAEIESDPEANKKRYTFPALTRNGGAGLEGLIQYALDWLAANVLGRGAGEVSTDRLILTAHSGGGAPLDRLLAAHADRAACNPHEVHVFDALYGPTTGLVGWVRDRIAADQALLASASALAGERLDLLATQGGALRIVYRGGTRKGSEAVALELPGSGDELAAAYRAELTSVEHGDIPGAFGGILLRDVRTDLVTLSQGHGLTQPLSADDPGAGERYGAPVGIFRHYQPAAMRRPGRATARTLDVTTVEALLTRARSALGRSVEYKLGAGGRRPDADTPADKENRCDCSGFVAWSLGLDRKTDHPVYVKHNGGWINTDAIIHDTTQSTGLFVRLDRPRVGALLVYGSTYENGKRKKPGHVGIVTELDEHGDASMMIDCGASSWRKLKDAIQEREPTPFKRSDTVIAWYAAMSDEAATTASAARTLSRPFQAVTPVARRPAIEEEPRYLDGAPEPDAGGRRYYTNYATVDAAAAVDEVRRVCAGGSWVERILRVITNEGRSKNFVTITGLDGLTFGITDFASDGGVHGFMTLCRQSRPEQAAAAFGDHLAEVTDREWIRENNGSRRKRLADDRGVIRFRWLREGLDRLLSDPALHGLQLAAFVRGKVSPSLEAFKDQAFTLELPVAVMVGIANSYGFRGMRRHFLIPALAEVEGRGVDRELGVAEHMLKAYVRGERREAARVPGLDVVARGFGRTPGGLPGEAPSGLGHRGTRAYLILRHFPAGAVYTGLGAFTLSSEERFDGEPTTGGSSAPAPSGAAGLELEKDWAQITQSVASCARREYTRWGGGDPAAQLVETDAGATAMLHDYWAAVGRDISDADLQDPAWQKGHPWSSAFIGWVMTEAGATPEFRASGAHYRYIAAAKGNRVSGSSNPVKAYRIDEVEPRPGDLICRARSNSGASYDNVDDGTSRATHADVVVEVGPTSVKAVGGNASDSASGLSNTVGRKSIALANGKVKLAGDLRNEFFAIVRIEPPAL